MKNVIKPQSYSVDAFDIVLFGSVPVGECAEKFSVQMKRTNTEIFFWNEAIKFSYLYHSDLERDLCALSEAQRGDEYEIMLCSVRVVSVERDEIKKKFVLPRADASIQYRIANFISLLCRGKSEFSEASLNKENFDKLLHIFSLCAAYLHSAPPQQHRHLESKKKTSICQPKRIFIKLLSH